MKAGISFLFLILFAYWIFSNATLVNDLVAGYGLVGILVAALVANASIFLPVPIDIVIFALGANALDFQELVVISIVAGIGAGIGEMSAYLFGLLGIRTAEKAKHKEFSKINVIEEKLGKKGMVFVFFGALTPFPFDIIGIVAGVIKYDPKKFLVAAIAGKIVRYFLISLAAYYGFAAVKAFFFISA